MTLLCSAVTAGRLNLTWYRAPSLLLTTGPDITITRLARHKLSLQLSHVDQSSLAQYRCVASNTVATSEAVFNFTGVPRAPVISSEQDSIRASKGSYLLTWSTMTLYPVVEYVLLQRRGWGGPHGEGWSRMVLPELCLPRHNIVLASYRQGWAQHKIN